MKLDLKILRFKELSILILVSGVFLSGCEDDEPEVLQASAMECTDHLFECSEFENNSYCLLGARFGGNGTEFGIGPEADGQMSPGGEITWAFAREGVTYNSFVASTIQLNATDPEDLPSCIPESVSTSFEDWEDVCDISFTEINDFEAADIQVIFGGLLPAIGLGFPENDEAECESFSSSIFLNTSQIDCNNAKFIALHEIGHVLGLGHVGSNNIMNPGLLDLTELQEGDIEGAQVIYGPN